MRIEKDNFGEVEINKNVLYGLQTIRTNNNLSFSNRTLKDYEEYVTSLVKVKKAAALANFEDNKFSKSVMDKISNACNEILEGKHRENFIMDVYHGGGGIGINMNVNEVIANLCNEKIGIYSTVHPINHVNASQSTSDVCHTAIRLAILESFTNLNLEIVELLDVMNKKTNEFMPITTISRTCLQDASRIQLGEKFSGFEAVIRRKFEKLKATVNELLTINLGGTAVGNGSGASIYYRKIIIQKLNEVTNQPVRRRENLIDAAQNIDDLLEVSKDLSSFASNLLKIAKDLRLLSSGPDAGFFEISLPEIQNGSSFYPGKVNPVIPETTIQCCIEIIGIERIVQATIEHGELDLNVYESFAGVHILDGIYMLTKCIHNFSKLCFEGIIANETRCTELAHSHITKVFELKEKYGYSETIKILKNKMNDVEDT